MARALTVDECNELTDRVLECVQDYGRETGWAWYSWIRRVDGKRRTCLSMLPQAIEIRYGKRDGKRRYHGADFCLTRLQKVLDKSHMHLANPGQHRLKSHGPPTLILTGRFRNQPVRLEIELLPDDREPAGVVYDTRTKTYEEVTDSQ